MTADGSIAPAGRARTLIGLVAWLLTSFAAGAAGGLASAGSGSFYLALERPPWAPPAWLFGPVWTVLYVLIGLAAWRVWRRWGFAGARAALGLYLVQLVLNGLWTWLFFAWRRGALAFAEIVVLLVLIVATAAAFWRRDRLAGALLLPYLAWVGFAAVLTWSVWQRNPGVLG